MNDQDLIVNSTGGLFPHTHKLVVPCAAVKNPPAEGLTLTTSVEYSLVFKHSHEVHFTSDELARIREGAEVTVRDTDKGRHPFTFNRPT